MCCDADTMALKLQAAGDAVLKFERAGFGFPARLTWEAAAAGLRHVQWEVDFFKDHIHLISISVPRRHRGKGHARAAMTALLAVADEFALPVSLEVAYPDDTDAARGMDPLTWYRRIGFEDAGMYGDMIRHPKQLEAKDV